MKTKGKDAHEKKLLADIQDTGWGVVKVLEDEDGPGFAFSIGLYSTYNHPEIIIVGLELDLMHTLINNIGHDIKGGKRHEAGKMYPDVLPNFEVGMLNVAKKQYKEFVGWALWYYEGDDFPLLQCVYPTTQGVYPWDRSWGKEFDTFQPILGDKKVFEGK